jgi:hypothetical protein
MTTAKHGVRGGRVELYALSSNTPGLVWAVLVAGGHLFFVGYQIQETGRPSYPKVS